MKYILSSLFLINTLLSLTCIISSIIWLHYNENYINTSQFGFYFCVTCISILLSALYLTLRYNCNNKINILNYGVLFLSIVMVILWLAASICMSLLTRECLLIKTNSCTVSIINISLGFIELIIWYSILWISCKRSLDIYTRYPALEAQASDEISRERRINQ